MKIIIANANTDHHDKEIDNYVDQYSNILIEKGHQVKQFFLRDLTINFCTGCWSCWWKTPGVCMFSDDAVEIYRECIHSDLFVFASPMVMGMVNYETKRLNDRLIPLLHPYITFVRGECHHKKRYKRYPLIGMIIKPEPESDEEDLEILQTLYQRYALNFRSELKFFISTHHNVEEAVHVSCDF